jgi:hypothetical protein
MNAPQHFQFTLIIILICASLTLPGVAQQSSDGSSTTLQNVSVKRDGQHDFDWEIGTWKTHLRRRLRPLTKSDTWVEYDGKSVCRKVWNGRANLLELEVEGPTGHIEGLSLRLYNPESRQWSLNFSNSAVGMLTEPVFGEFKNGRGEFFGKDSLNGRVILVRFVISCADSNSCRFEQAFSDDAGNTWEVNWIAIDTRVKD